MNACAMVAACQERQVGAAPTPYELDAHNTVESTTWNAVSLLPTDTGRPDVIPLITEATWTE